MSSLDNIPLTVIQLENKLRGNNEKSWKFQEIYSLSLILRFFGGK
jgi:hypothetical protein